MDQSMEARVPSRLVPDAFRIGGFVLCMISGVAAVYHGVRSIEALRDVEISGVFWQAETPRQSTARHDAHEASSALLTDTLVFAVGAATYMAGGNLRTVPRAED